MNGIWMILTYSIITFIINVLVRFFFDEDPFLYEALTIFEFALFAAFIYYQVKNKSFRKIAFYLSTAAIAFFLVFSFFLNKEISIDSIQIGIETILILGFAFYFLYEQTNDTTTLFIYNKPSFWIVLGIVLYLAGNFFIYIFANYATQKIIEKYWFVTNIFSILKNIFFCIGIYLNAKPPKDSLKYNFELSQLN